MITCTNTVFIVVSIVTVIIFLFCLALSYTRGGKGSFNDLACTVVRVSVIGFATYYLSKSYNLLPEEGFYQYIDEKRKRIASLASKPPFTPDEVNRLRFIMSALIWLIITAVIVTIIESIIRNAIRKSAKVKEKKPIGKADHFLGYVFGTLMFCVIAFLPSLLFISMENLNIITNGRDLINKTLLNYPVNYAVKPLTYVILPKESADHLWENGITAFFNDPEGVENWIGENSGSEN